MKKKLLVIFLVICVGMASLAWAGMIQQRLKVVLARKSAAASGDFVFTVTTAGADTFTVPIYDGGTYDFTIDCAGGTGGGAVTSFNDADRVCSYAGGGTYTITIAGTIIGWDFSTSTDNLLIRDIISWGPLRLGNTNKYFSLCTNLTVSATDVLDLTGTTVLDYMFNGCSSLTVIPSLDSWDVSNVTDMRSMFVNCSQFNQDISSWDVSSVTNMRSMFQNAAVFNQDISSWNVASLTNTYAMFAGAAAFNQDISGWSIGGTSREHIFNGASSFNQDLSSWDVSGVTTIEGMFKDATSFDQDLGIWDIALVTDATDFLLNVTLTTSNYNSLLIGWEANSHQDNVTFHGGGSKYSAGAATTARTTLDTTDGWTITDGGQE